MSTTPTLPVETSPIYRDVELKGPDVLVDDRVQQREVWPDTAKVEEYAALYHEGRDLGRLVFFHDAAEQVLVLADGFHRRSAAILAGLTTLPAVIYEGGLRDAVFYATSCNLHGMALSNANKRKRVTTLLEAQGDRTILTRLPFLTYIVCSAAPTKTPHERRIAQRRAPGPGGVYTPTRWGRLPGGAARRHKPTCLTPALPHGPQHFHSWTRQ